MKGFSASYDEHTTSVKPRGRAPVEIGVQTNIVKGAMSTKVKLTTAIEESPCGVIDYGMASHHMTLSHVKVVESNAIFPVSVS